MPRSQPDGPTQRNTLATVNDFLRAPQPFTPPTPARTSVQHSDRKPQPSPAASAAESSPRPVAREIANSGWTPDELADLAELGPAAPPREEVWKAISPIEETFRHSSWRARRLRVAAALRAACVPERREINFANCGQGATVWQHDVTGALKVRASYCHDRFCQPCQLAKATRLQIGLRNRVPKGRTLHVVLTLRSSKRDLGEQLDHLYASFRRLRAAKLWKTRVAGGYAALELTRNLDTEEWHPHLHCLVHCEWLDQRDLSDAWSKASRGSSVVHVSLVEQTDRAVREVTKYLSKPIHRSIDFHPASLVDLIGALHGRHMYVTFGAWRKDPLLADTEPEPDDHWSQLCTLHQLAADAARNDRWAQQALAYLHSLIPGRVDRTPPPPRDSS